MQRMVSRKSEALWTASQRKMRHDEPWQKSVTTCGVHLCMECFTLFHTLKEPTCVKASEMSQEQQQVMANASRKSDALWSASKIKMRHDNTRQNKCDQKTSRCQGQYHLL